MPSPPASRPTIDARRRGSRRRHHVGDWPLAWITGCALDVLRHVDVLVSNAPACYDLRTSPRPEWDLAIDVNLQARASPRPRCALDLCTGCGREYAARTLAPAAVPDATGDRRRPRSARASSALARCNGVDRWWSGPRRRGATATRSRSTCSPRCAPYVPTGALAATSPPTRRRLRAARRPRRRTGRPPRGPAAWSTTRRRLLRPGGWLVVEVGGTQDDALEPELAAHGLRRRDHLARCRRRPAGHGRSAG